MGKIVVFHRGALGDFLLACPVIKGLSELTKGQVYLITRQEYSGLMVNAPFFAGFMPHDAPVLMPFFDEDLWKKAEVPDKLAEAEALFFFGQRSLKDVVDRLNKRLGKNICYWIQSFPDPGSGVKRHVTFYLCDQLRELGFPVRPLRFNPLDYMANLPYGPFSDERPVVIHTGSGGMKKIWPLKNWWSVIVYIKRKYPTVPVVLVVGPADEIIIPLAKKAEELFGVGIVENPELVRLAYILGRSQLYMGNDSGVSHLAAAVGAACCVVFGPTDPDVWAPLGKDVTVVRDLWDETEITALNFDVTQNPALHSGVRAFIDGRVMCTCLPEKPGDLALVGSVTASPRP